MRISNESLVRWRSKRRKSTSPYKHHQQETKTKNNQTTKNIEFIINESSSSRENINGKNNYE